LDVCSRAEILCIQPSIAVLKLKHLGIVDDITKFDWLEPPSHNSLEETVKCLTWLGALDLKTGKLTDLGRRMAKLGLEPMLSVMIFTAQKFDCLSYILALAGMLSVVQNIWWRGKDDQSKQLSDEKRASFIRDTEIGGDYIVLLRIFLEWHALGESKDRRKAWCRKHMISWKSLKMANSFVRELAYQIGSKVQIHFSKLTEDLIRRIVHCICAGYFQNLAISNGPIRAGYQLAIGTTGTVARINRSSTVTFAQQPPTFILYHEILNVNETNYLTVICPVQLDWLDKVWLDSLPRSPLQCVLEDYTFVNIGPALLLSVVGKKCRKVPQLEEQLQVLFEVDYARSKLTIWGHTDKLFNAQQHLQEILNREREKLRNELQEFEIIGSTRILLGAGAEPQLALVDDEYIKILLTNLPKNITEEKIQENCEQYGQGKLVSEKTFRSTLFVLILQFEM
jgi:HrpA-like RNA helicase